MEGGASKKSIGKPGSQTKGIVPVGMRGRPYPWVIQVDSCLEFLSDFPLNSQGEAQAQRVSWLMGIAMMQMDARPYHHLLMNPKPIRKPQVMVVQAGKAHVVQCHSDRSICRGNHPRKANGIQARSCKGLGMVKADPGVLVARQPRLVVLPSAAQHL